MNDRSPQSKAVKGGRGGLGTGARGACGVGRRAGSMSVIAWLHQQRIRARQVLRNTHQEV